MTNATETEPIEARIKAYIQAQLPGTTNISISTPSRASTGFSRENWTFDARWEEAGQEVMRKLILRRDPTGSVLDTEREPEFRALKALEATGLPVPRVYWLETEGRWLERPFIIMERYDGKNDRRVLNITQFPTLYPTQMRERLAHRIVEILAAIHTVDWRQLYLPGFTVPNEPYDAACTEIEKWEAYLANQTLEPQPVLTAALCWMKRHMPAAEHTTIVHGDFRPGNSLFKDDEVVVMLDWEMVHLGDPMEDIGWYTMPHYAPEHFIPGVWEKQDFYARYQELTGFQIDEEAVHFWQVLGCFKLAAIGQTGVKSFCEGRTDRANVGSLGMQNNLARLIGI